MKGRALRRALASRDAHRVSVDLPLITDVTEMVDPNRAYELLAKNKDNRPVNWKKVEEYAAIMIAGQWALQAQGIILDGEGSILTGQTRLWAVIKANATVPLRISKGSPKETARLIDRGRPQTPRDLATRTTGEKHGPTEVALARAVLALRGVLRPSADLIAAVIEEQWKEFGAVLRAISGMKRTRAVLMTVAALCSYRKGAASPYALHVEAVATKLSQALLPQTAEGCWGKGAAFSLAMKRAEELVRLLPTA